MKHYYCLAVAACLAAFSCSEKQAPGGDCEPSNWDECVSEIICTIPGSPLTETKSTFDGDGTFSWSENDMVSIWPLADDLFEQTSNGCVIFKSQSSGPSTTFRGNGWGLLRGHRYCASYPNNSENTYSRVPISYLNQRQSEDAVASHLGKYDYLHTQVDVADTGAVEIPFNRLGVMMKFNIQAPSGICYRKFEMESSEKIFIRSAEYKPSDSVPEITPLAHSRCQTLALGETGLNAVNGNLTLFLMMSPINWSGKQITFSLVDAENNLYSDTVTPSKPQEAGKGYSLNLSLSSTGQKDRYPDYVDLGLNALWATTNVGADSPEEYGGYYGWGETMGYGEADPSNYMNLLYNNGNPVKTYYWMETYKFQTSSFYGPTAEYELWARDDAAYVADGLRTPDEYDWDELSDPDKITFTHVDNYMETGVAGMLFTSKVSGFEGNSIFIPYNGHISKSVLEKAGEAGSYWARNILLDCSSLIPRHMGFSSKTQPSKSSLCTNWPAYPGCGIRPVKYDKDVVRKVVIWEVQKKITSGGQTLTCNVGDVSTIHALVHRTSWGVSGDVTWHSTNESVATVEHDNFESGMVKGKITAVASGKADIVATTVSGGLTAQIHVVVQ